LRSKYIKIKLNKDNEIRADVDISIGSLGLLGLTEVNVKIDTGCPYTSIPFQKLGKSKALSKEQKIKDCENVKIKKELSFGVNDSEEYREEALDKFRGGEYSELRNITFRHRDFKVEFNGVEIQSETVKISYDRTGNILIGMDILSKLDTHIGKSIKTGEIIFLACPLESINDEYLTALEEEFGICTSINAALIRSEL